ncbi:MAG TPA: hypothetical protein VLA00_11995 [Xanthobacteraceae bacterium]|nr:hypothetical protein [Xanthobacteraceae bacterium]
MSTADFLMLMIMPVGALAVGGLVYWVASHDRETSRIRPGE